MTDPIRIFIGASPNGHDAECAAVLDYTLHKNTKRELEIYWMILSRDPDSWYFSDPAHGAGWHTEAWPTPFSAFRWAVPSFADFHGRALYMDCDMICRADISELWDMEMLPGKFVIAKDYNRLCVSLWDCRAAGDFMPEMWRIQAIDGHAQMRDVIRHRSAGVQCFAPSENWNCLDLEGLQIDDPSIKMIHMTSMPHQPHLDMANARLGKRGQRHWFNGKITPHFRPELAELFVKLLHEADAAGFKVENYDDPANSFGDYTKGDLSGLVGNTPGWGKPK